MVNTDKRICRMLSALLSMYGVKDIVFSPGSRNTPLIMAASRNKLLNCRQIVDERSAAFIGLGIAVTTNRPVALICTSGSAVLNYAPAIAEAFYRQIPLIVISADRPKEWIDQDDSQTIRQPGTLANITLDGCTLEDSDNDYYYQNRVLNGILSKAVNGRRGPVHINLHLSTPLSVESEINPEEETPVKVDFVESLPRVSTAQAREMAEQLQDKKVLIVGGINRPDSKLNKALGELAALPSVAVVTEGIANVHSQSVYSNPAIILSGISPADRSNLTPDVIISFGGALVSHELKEFLRSCFGARHWCIGRRDEITDCFRLLTRIINIAPEGVFPRLAGALTYRQKKSKYESNYARLWHDAAAKSSISSEAFIAQSPWSDLTAIGRLLPMIPTSANLQLGNGMSVRYALLHNLTGFHRVDSNRGVSGIDGCLATAIGSASVYSGPTYAIVGDMSTVYDIGSLSNISIAPRLRLIVMNNGGGGIFHFVGTTRRIPEKEVISASPSPPLAEVAQTWNFRYFAAYDFESLTQAMQALGKKSDKPAVLEIFTDGEISAGIMREYLTRYKN